MTDAALTPPPSWMPPDSPSKVQIWNAALDSMLADDIPLIAQSARVDDPVSEVGLLAGQLGLDEAAAEFLVEGNHLRMVIADEDVFTARIEPEITYQRVHIDGGAAEVATFECRGHVVELDDVTIDAFGGPDARPQALQRPMSWCSPEADLSGLDPAVVLYDELSVPWDTPQTDPPWFSPWYPPRGYADPTSSWIWASEPDPEDGHPPQTRRFVKDITIADDGLYCMFAAADDGFTLLGNGIKLGEGNKAPGDSFIVPWTAAFELKAGTLRIGIEGYNYERPTVGAVGTFGGPNVGRVAWCMYYMPDGVNTVLTDALLVAHTDDTWLTLDTDDPLPAPTWDVIVQTFLDEAPATSRASEWSINVVGTLSQQGDQSFGIADDTTILGVLRQGATSGCIDWKADRTDKIVHIADFGTLGSTKSTDYTKANGTLIDLQERTLTGFCNSLDVRHKTGRELVEDSASIATYGLVRRSLPLADLDRDAAVAQANRELAVRKERRSSLTAAIECDAGTANAPYGVGGWLPGDSPKFEGTNERVVRVSTTFDAGGNPIFLPELRTRRQGEAERQQISLSKAGANLDGTSRAATALEGLTSNVVAGFTQDLDPLVFTQIQLTPDGLEDLYDVSNARTWEVAGRVHRVDLTQFVPPQDVDTIVNLVQSGPAGTSTVLTITLPVGFYRATECPFYLHVGELDNLHMEIVQHDTAVDDPDNPDLDARWLTMTVRAVGAHPATVQPAAVEVPW